MISWLVSAKNQTLSHYLASKHLRLIKIPQITFAKVVRQKTKPVFFDSWFITTTTQANTNESSHTKVVEKV